jgi:hypothetical protein
MKRWILWKESAYRPYSIILYGEPNLNEHDRKHAVAPPVEIDSKYDTITDLYSLEILYPCPESAPLPKAVRPE